MTRKKDLKRRVRARQQRTGEPYTAARRAVLEGAPTETDAEPPGAGPTAPARPPFQVVEMDDCTTAAAAAGLRCTAAVARELAEQVDVAAALRRLRAALDATADDPAFEQLRAVALRGERPRRARPPDGWPEGLRRFMARARAGIGGVSEGGTMLALQVEGARGMVTMLCHLGFGIVYPGRRPDLVLTTPGAAAFHLEPMAMRALLAPR